MRTHLKDVPVDYLAPGSIKQMKQYTQEDGMQVDLPYDLAICSSCQEVVVYGFVKFEDQAVDIDICCECWRTGKGSKMILIEMQLKAQTIDAWDTMWDT